MEVILLEKVAKLGSVGQRVKVKPGYGRNYLLPKNLAVRATKESLALVESRIAEIQKRNQEKFENAQKIAEQFAGLAVSLNRQIGEDGKLFGSVTTKDVAEAVNALTGLTLSRADVLFPAAIKYAGEYNIKVVLHADVMLEVKVSVVRAA